MGGIFSADPYVIEFVRGNIVSLGMAYVLLRGIAKLTPSAIDDRIATLFGSLFKFAKKSAPVVEPKEVV